MRCGGDACAYEMPNADPQPLHLLVGTTRDAVFGAIVERLGTRMRLDRAVSAETLVDRATKASHDACLVDQHLSASPSELLAQLTRLGKDPVLIVVSASRELPDRAGAFAAEHVALDATDAATLEHLVRGLIARARVKDVQLPRDVLEAIVERAPIMVSVIDATGHVTWVNREQERVLGWTNPDLRHSQFVELCGSDTSDRERAGRLIRTADGGWETFRVRRRDGRAIETGWLAIRLPNGMLVAMGRDVTEQRNQGRRLARAEKLEALGRLTGGIAHDFNNLLTVIAGNAQLLLDKAVPPAGERVALEEVVRAADSAGAMVKQLLTFSGREPQTPAPINLNAAIAAMRGMVARLIGSEVHLEFELAAEPSIVRFDLGHIEQIVINLLLNARDAMPHGGRAYVRTATADAAPAAGGRRLRVRQGRYMTLSVTDTGVGMDAETLERVFEPFFTTRASAGGTGLGLASVQAIVTQAGGSIEVTSEPGQGSTFTVYLPAADSDVPVPAEAVHDLGPGRVATVLVVEDHDVIRRLCRRVLENEGHTVTEASSVEQALQRASEMPDLDLLLADVRLGGENGLELARTLRADRPAVRVLLMSGYASPQADDAAFLEKPFTPAALVSAVRQVLSR